MADGPKTHGGNNMKKCLNCNSRNIIEVEDKTIVSNGYSNSYSSYCTYIECEDCGHSVPLNHVCKICASKKPGDNGIICNKDCANRIGNYCGYNIILGECECEEDIGECIPEYKEEG